MPKIPLLVFVILLSLHCSAQVYQYNEEEILSNRSVDKIIEVLNNENLKFYAKASGIPTAVKRIVSSRGQKFRIVDVGKDYQAGCIVNGRPERQLIALFRNEEYGVLTYNHGGVGNHSHIMYFRIQNSAVTEFWVGLGEGRDLANKEKIKEILLVNRGREWGLHTNMVEY
jgi:hypothetical protein